MAGRMLASARAGNIIPSCRHRSRSRLSPGHAFLSVPVSAQIQHAALVGMIEWTGRNELSSLHVTFASKEDGTTQEAELDATRASISLVQPRL